MDKIISGWARAKILFLGLAKARITTREKALWAHVVKHVEMSSFLHINIYRFWRGENKTFPHISPRDLNMTE